MSAGHSKVPLNSGATLHQRLPLPCSVIRGHQHQGLLKGLHLNSDFHTIAPMGGQMSLLRGPTSAARPPLTWESRNKHVCPLRHVLGRENRATRKADSPDRFRISSGKRMRIDHSPARGSAADTRLCSISSTWCVPLRCPWRTSFLHDHLRILLD